MLTHPTSERLTVLGLSGMARALDGQRRAGVKRGGGQAKRDGQGQRTSKVFHQFHY